MADIKTLVIDLRRAAEEIRAERHNGWGNTCAAAADALDTLAEAHQAEVAILQREAEVTQGVLRNSMQCSNDLLAEVARLTRENEGLNRLLRDAYRGLHDLLQDTQHSEHFCGDPNCPVKFAEEVDERLRAALAGASGAQITKDEHGKA